MHELLLHKRETLKGLKKLAEFLAVFPRPTAERNTRKQKNSEILHTSAQLLSSCQPLGRAGRVNRAPHLRPHPMSSFADCNRKKPVETAPFRPTGTPLIPLLRRVRFVGVGRVGGRVKALGPEDLSRCMRPVAPKTSSPQISLKLKMRAALEGPQGLPGFLGWGSVQRVGEGAAEPPQTLGAQA